MLKRGIRHSADPMFWNIAGNNYLALKQYDQGNDGLSAKALHVSNRVYPLYLLTKLEAERGDTTMMNYYGRILLGKRPKVPSLAVDEMKFEIRKNAGCETLK